MTEDLQKAALRAQQTEITEWALYTELSKKMPESNAKVLRKIADEEQKHYEFWKKITKKEIKPQRMLVLWYLLLARVLGIIFAIRLRESGERGAQKKYRGLMEVKGIEKLIVDEERHEQALIAILKDERLDYAGSIVLGLNDALVELTGALAGFTLALRDPRIVAMAGMITGFAAALSMAASGYFQSKEDGTKNPIKSAVYTGVAYIIVVILLIVPYLVFTNVYAALGITLSIAVLIIAGYTMYISVARNLSFGRRFLEMAAISLTVAAVSFCFGLVLNHFFGI